MARVSTTFNLNRKLTAAFQVVITGDNGGSWTTPSFTTNTTLNTVTFDYDALVDVAIFHYETQAHFTQDDVIGESLDKSTNVQATNNHEDAILVSSIKGVIPTSTDSPEELATTKTVDGVVSHTPESIAADVLYTTQLEPENGVAKLVFNIDDSGVIDGTNAQSFNTQYFIDESN